MIKTKTNKTDSAPPIGGVHGRSREQKKIIKTTKCWTVSAHVLRESPKFPKCEILKFIIVY